MEGSVHMTQREEVLASEDQAWVDLTAAVVAISAERRNAEGVVPGWSTHDIVWHVAYWVGPVAPAMELIRHARSDPQDEDASEAENATIAEAGRAMTWDEVMAHAEHNRVSARKALEAFDGVVPERAIEFFSDYTIEHYREHEAQIRAFAGFSPSYHDGQQDGQP